MLALGAPRARVRQVRTAKVVGAALEAKVLAPLRRVIRDSALVVPKLALRAVLVAVVPIALRAVGTLPAMVQRVLRVLRLKT